MKFIFIIALIRIGCGLNERLAGEPAARQRYARKFSESFFAESCCLRNISGVTVVYDIERQLSEFTFFANF